MQYIPLSSVTNRPIQFPYTILFDSKSHLVEHDECNQINNGDPVTIEANEHNEEQESRLPSEIRRTAKWPNQITTVYVAEYHRLIVEG